MLGRDKWTLSAEVCMSSCDRLVAAATVKNLTISDFSLEQRRREQTALYGRFWRTVAWPIMCEIRDTVCAVIYV